jgi:hypothetical protein
MPTSLTFVSRRVLLPALGLALALSAIGLAAPAADARPKRPVDEGVHCVIYHRASGEIEFFLPGDIFRGSIGQSWLCGPRGVWL